MKNTINTPQHIVDKANAMVAKGSAMKFEAICEMYIKMESKSSKKLGSKKEEAKWANREIVRNAEYNGNASVWLAEKNRENAMNNLPSSLKK
jgi:hypothetical protein